MQRPTADPNPICGQLLTAFPRLSAFPPQNACQHRCADLCLNVAQRSTAFHHVAWPYLPKLIKDAPGFMNGP
jgi:hypothetical protein